MSKPSCHPPALQGESVQPVHSTSTLLPNAAWLSHCPGELRQPFLSIPGQVGSARLLRLEAGGEPSCECHPCTPWTTAQQPASPGRCRGELSQAAGLGSELEEGPGEGKICWRVGREDLASLQVQRQQRTGCLHSACLNSKHPPFFPQRAWHKTPIPPSPNLCRGSQCSTYPSKCHSDQPQDRPLNAPRPSRRESCYPAWVWLWAGVRRESRLLTPWAQCRGSRKQLNFTTARSVTASWRRGG